eukprot:TRINITY_DN3860_c0_g3_i5.p1 TRINITY_DN3860_c0_g3~~TRINITY_DN3860_c0_g3_i5.p1  ORF type:complete len:166 (+),score=30.46 TRINITY_DN3860_c0_g3_i5:351-848(+)
MRRDYEEQVERRLQENESTERIVSTLGAKLRYLKDTRDHIAKKLYFKNLKRRFFHLLNIGSNTRAYRRKMMYLSRKHYRRKWLKNILKRWQEQTRIDVRASIQLKFNQTSELEVNRIKREHEEIISTLKGHIAEKLRELQKEEDTHRSLFERYQDMVNVSKVDMK